MTLVTGIDSTLDFDEFLRLEGAAFGRPEVREIARWAVDEAQALIEPALVFDWFPIRYANEGYVDIGGSRFIIGNHAFLMEPAAEACVSVMTIGSALEERVGQLMKGGDAFRGYILDEMGVFALASVLGPAIHRIAQDEGARRGWGVGAELGPGRLPGWDVAEQKLICGLLNVGSIGISCTEAGMLVPQKSASAIVGIGPDFTAEKVHPPCDFCKRKETCTWVQ